MRLGNSTRLLISMAGAAVLCVAAGAPVPTAGPVATRPADADPDAALLAALNQADIVFVGKVSRVVRGPVAMSDPPIHTLRLSFTAVKVIKGDSPGRGDLSYRARQRQPPAVAEGDRLLVAAAAVPRRRGSFRVVRLAPADAKNLKLAAFAAKLPTGWSVVDGKPVSPFASLGAKAWPAGAKPTAELVCSKTGRPGLLCGPAVKVAAKWVPSDKPVKYANPYGDGRFKITVTNTSAKAVDVPALLADATGEVLWADSLVVVWRGRGLTLPEAGKVPPNVKAAKLAAGASVSTVVNALGLEGVSWPRGGSRVTLRFGLGEKSGESFFYYLSRHHDKLRPRPQGG